MGRASLLLAVGVAAGCASGPLELPQPPEDVTATVQAYAMPTGTVDLATVSQIAANAQAELQSKNLDWLPVAVTRTLVLVRQRFDQEEFPFDPFSLRNGSRPKLDAFAVVDSPCSGWGGGTAGSINLTAVVSDTELQRQVFGTATACQTQVHVGSLVTINGFIDATVALFLQGPLPESSEDAQMVVVLNGQVGREGNVVSGGVDFRVVGPTVEFRHAVSDGDVIVSVTTTSIDVRAANGTFQCTLSGGSCTQV